MSIAFACSACGNSLTLSDHFAGRKIKCPQCGGKLTVPAAAAEAIPLSPESDDNLPVLPEASVPAPPALPPRRQSQPPVQANKPGARKKGKRKKAAEPLIWEQLPVSSIAMVCALLAQDALTGQTLVVDGGRLL